MPAVAPRSDADAGPTNLTGDDHPWADPRGIPVPGVSGPVQSKPDPEQVPLELETERHNAPSGETIFTPLKEEKT